MKIRISFRAEVYVTAEDMREVKTKFHTADLLANETNMPGVTPPEFVEVVSVEDAKTYNDMRHEFDHAFNK